MFRWALSALALLAVLPCTARGEHTDKEPASPKQPRTSFVFLLADDLRFNSLGCMGDRVVKTPHLDRLAAQGVLFRNCFVTTSICAVSRASIFSGQYARRHGINDFTTPFAAARWGQTYPALLRKAGYRTGFVGKFGVGKDVRPMANHFDFWRGLPGQAGPFFDPKDKTHTHATARFGGQALEFLRGCKPDQPFCLSVSFSAPHARDGQPREYPPDRRDEGLYTDVKVPVPKLATDEAFRRLPAFVQKSEGRRRWQRRFSTPELFQRVVKDYYRLITGVDREVGRIVAELDRLGLAGHTVLVFTSDNGYILGERGLADKWLPYEESIRVPLIVQGPRLPRQARGRREAAVVLNIDLAPTLLDLAGLSVPAAMQGRSLVPLLRDGKAPPGWRSEFFYEHLTLPKIIPPTEGVWTERWKYFRWVGASPAVEELYDLQADPLEEHNLAGQKEHQKTLGQLRERWQRLREELK
jgi:arylsulfatase A-like enzyme